MPSLRNSQMILSINSASGTAFKEFDWIDRNFVPIDQLDKKLRPEEHLKVAQTAIPTLKLRLTGQTSEPAPACSKIVIHLNRRLERAPHSESLGDSDKALQSYVDSLDDDEKDLDGDPDAVDRWDGPGWIFEPGETAFASTATYVFCPAPHRKQLLCIVVCHFCEHPLFPDRTGSTRSSEKIRYDAVWETYQFCFQRSGCVPPSQNSSGAGAQQCLKNFWRNLKHQTLHHFLHPCLNQLVYLIEFEVLLYTEAKMQIFETEFHPGPAKTLTPYRKAFKNLLEDPSDLSTWTFSCGQQRYNAFLLCKHLGQAFDPPHPDFFRKAVRCQVTPFYSHRLLRLKDGSEFNLVASGYVSDGTKRKRVLPAQVMTSPPRSGSGLDPFLLSSSPFIADEEEDDSSLEWVKKRIIEVEAGLPVLKTQLKIWEGIEMIPDHLATMGGDVRRFTEAGAVRTITHAQKGKKPSVKFTWSTMGLYIP
ncbi:hypothetical protein B0H19DRAFT_1275831 [Mycena capillaripes]|nr:hypothetical protein B0H19DRAFT_1275831 [Mycena capillaripes]